MNTSLSAYTHLESLLLFQSLNAYGVGHNIFSRISELLKNNPTITTDKRFQSGRLSPDALRNFVLHILGEEVKSEQQHGGLVDGDGQNGEVKNPRKRKAPSPGLGNVQDAAQHAHLIPQLVTKLYARYRTALTNEIRDEEDRYERLQGELRSIERGERDSELVERANGKTPVPRSPSVSRKSPLVQQKPLPPSPSPQLAVQDGNRLATRLSNTHIADGPLQAGPEFQKPLPPPNGQIPSDRNTRNVPSPSPRKKTATTPSTPLPVPGPALSPQQSRAPQPLAPPPGFLEPQPPPANAEYNAPPAQAQRPPYHRPALQPQVQVSQGDPPPASPHAPNQAPPRHPPSPAALSPSGTQFQPPPIQPYPGHGHPQYNPVPGPPPQISPTQQRAQGPYPPGPQSPGIQTPQQQRNIYPHSGQPAYPPPQQPQAGQPPPQGGFMLPPFQVSPQDPSRSHQQLPPQYPQVSTPLARQPPPTIRPGSSTASGSRQGLPPIQYPFPRSRSAFSTPLSARSIGTPRSAKSMWKPLMKSFAVPTEPPRPDVSPIDDVGPLETSKQSQPKSKAPRKPRAKGKAKEKDPEKEKEPEPEPDKSEEQVPEMETRQGRSLRKGTSRRGRPGSIASSQAGGSIREPSRSQSVISHTETIAAENESQAGTHVKSERGMSIDAIEEDSGTPSQPRTRRRAGTMRGQKRKAREASLPESEDRPDTPGMPKVVIAPRHFSRMCNPIMNDIGSHKHASTFTTAVKPKDAEGYYEIIKRPTDLKSIQKAIGAGAKAVASHASDTPAGSPGGGGGIVELPMSADVTPPKAIVNSAQLEKELMRMFVNAVMFNAGEEGVVSDAREMFESTQRSVSNWRSAERSSGRLEVEETPVPEEDAPTASKRRKL